MSILILDTIDYMNRMNRKSLVETRRILYDEQGGKLLLSYHNIVHQLLCVCFLGRGSVDFILSVGKLCITQ